jgi:hypothetical protein
MDQQIHEPRVIWCYEIRQRIAFLKSCGWTPEEAVSDALDGALARRPIAQVWVKPGCFGKGVAA